jgi:hypothetical protein
VPRRDDLQRLIVAYNGTVVRMAAVAEAAAAADPFPLTHLVRLSTTARAGVQAGRVDAGEDEYNHLNGGVLMGDDSDDDEVSGVLYKEDGTELDVWGGTLQIGVGWLHQTLKMKQCQPEVDHPVM